MKGIRFLILLLSMEAKIYSTARILAIFPLPSEENQLAYRAFINGLAKQGHNIVVMTTNPINTKDKEFDNIKEISVEIISYKFWDELTMKSCLSTHCVMSAWNEAILELVDLQFSTTGMKNIFRNERLHFDLIIVESMLPALYSIGYKFGAPVIGVASQNYYIGNIEVQRHPGNKILYADFIISQDVKNKSSLQKLKVISSCLLDVFLKWITHDRSHAAMAYHLGAPLPIGVGDRRKISSLLLSFEVRLNGVKPLPPAVIPVGSLKFNATQIIDKGLKQFMDRSKQGFIYVNLELSGIVYNLPPETMKILLEVFADLPYNVLLKWPMDILAGRPDNVYISKSFPQYSVLRHPNIKAFIMRCRTQFLDEAIFNKVPVIAIVVSEEHEDHNMRNVNTWSIGEIVDPKNSSKQHLKRIVLNVASSPNYTANINKISRMLHAAPKTDLETAIWWTEYVLRHNGFGHLSTPTVSQYEYLMLDVIAFVFLSIVIGLSFLLWTVLTLFPGIPS